MCLVESLAASGLDSQSAVHRAVATGFQRCLQLARKDPQLGSNSLKLDNIDAKNILHIDSGVCYDDFASKVASWKSAGDIVCQMLQCDMEINTGLVMKARHDGLWAHSDVLAVL